MKGYARIHAVATCDVCDWSYTDISGHNHKHDTGKKAKEHAETTGHPVTVEIGFHKKYRGEVIKKGVA